MNSIGIIFLILCGHSLMANALIVSQSAVYRGITFDEALTVNTGATVRFVDSQIQVHQAVNIQPSAYFYSLYTSPQGAFNFYEGIITNMGKFVVDGYNKLISYGIAGGNNGGIVNSGRMLFGLGTGGNLVLKYVTNQGSIYVASPDTSNFLMPYGLNMSPGASICLMNSVYKLQGYTGEASGAGGCISLLGSARIEGGNGGIDSRITVVMSQFSAIIIAGSNEFPMTVSNFGQGNKLGSFYPVQAYGYDPNSGILTIVNTVGLTIRYNIGRGYLPYQFYVTSFVTSGMQPNNAILYNGYAPNGRLACNCDTDFGTYNPFTEYITTVSDVGTTYSADVLITTSMNRRWYTTTSIIPAPPAPSTESSTTSTAPSSIESSTQSSIVESSTEPSIASSTQSSSFEPSPSETPSEVSPTESSILSSSKSVESSIQSSLESATSTDSSTVESATESSILDSSVSDSSTESSAGSSSEASTITPTDTSSSESSIVEETSTDSSTVESSTESSIPGSSESDSSTESSEEPSSETSTDTPSENSTESSTVEDPPSDSSICIQVTVTAEAVTVTVPNPGLPVDTISSLESTTITTTVTT
ncbi:uncharacterized protein RJT20DRAFT_133283 [Scheffersomyces xylosifermentans]|uniref:uncharacterized protein n=1 Tax=Scheffersomyces xylosifermentans TaxID=1304137 RepID=UPI00315C515C